MWCAKNPPNEVSFRVWMALRCDELCGLAFALGRSLIGVVVVPTFKVCGCLRILFDHYCLYPHPFGITQTLSAQSLPRSSVIPICTSCGNDLNLRLRGFDLGFRAQGLLWHVALNFRKCMVLLVLIVTPRPARIGTPYRFVWCFPVEVAAAQVHT